jgi:hypothetical protein
MQIIIIMRVSRAEQVTEVGAFLASRDATSSLVPQLGLERCDDLSLSILNLVLQAARDSF